jgi:hypothetical protein
LLCSLECLFGFRDKQATYAIFHQYLTLCHPERRPPVDAQEVLKRSIRRTVTILLRQMKPDIVKRTME